MQKKYMRKHIEELHKEIYDGLEDKRMPLNKFGLLVFKKWKEQNLHGHLLIKKMIIKRYKITAEDLKSVERECNNYYMRNYTKQPAVKERRSIREKDMRKVYRIYLKNKKKKLQQQGISNLVKGGNNINGKEKRNKKKT